VEKPSTPWRRALATEVPEEIKKANPPGTVFRHVWKGSSGPGAGSTRVHTLKQSGYHEPKIPKELANQPDGTYGQKDTRLLALTPERKQARDYYVQERSEQHLPNSQAKNRERAARAGFLTKEDSVDLGGGDDE
jgi:hypothetical protein